MKKTQPKPTPKSGGKKPVVVKSLERRTREIALPKIEIKTKTLATDKDMLGKAKGKTIKALLSSGKNIAAYKEAMSGINAFSPELVKKKFDNKPYKRALPKKK
jgi:hypothetical protein